MPDPGVLGVLLRFDAREPMVVQIVHAIGDPIDVLFACQDHLAFNPGTLWASDHKQIGKAGHHQAKIIAGTVLPLLSDRQSGVGVDIDTPGMPGMPRKSTAFLPRYQKFESISLQRRVYKLSVPGHVGQPTRVRRSHTCNTGTNRMKEK